MIFIEDADTYLKGQPDLNYNEVKEQLSSFLIEKLREERFSGQIHLILIKNCLESLICCDLAVIWKTNIPPTLTEEIPDPLPDIHDCEKTIHCPTNKLKEFVREYTNDNYNKMLHPSIYAKEINIKKLSKENSSFKELLDLIKENVRIFKRE